MDALNFCGNHADERNVLVDENTLADKVFPKSPHLVTAQVLIGKRKFDIVSGMAGLVYLEGVSNGNGL